MTEGNTGTRGDFRDRIVDDYSGYKVYDQDGEKLGKVDFTVLDDGEQPEYLGVKTGFFGSKVTLVPESMIRMNDSSEFSVQATEKQVNDAPTFGEGDDLSPDFEERTLRHYGLGRGGQDSSGAGAAAGAASGTTDYDRDSDRDRDRSSDRDRDVRSEDRVRDEDRNRDARSEDRVRDEGRDREDRGEDRSGDRGYGEDRDRDENRVRGGDEDRDRDRSSGSTAAAATGAAGVGAAGAAASGSRDRNRSEDTERQGAGNVERQEGSFGSSRGNEGEGEKIRVTLKREKARAERVIGEDGEEEVRIRKRMVEEEALVDVQDVEDNENRR